jgi:hypothetical protein
MLIDFQLEHINPEILEINKMIEPDEVLKLYDGKEKLDLNKKQTL